MNTKLALGSYEHLEKEVESLPELIPREFVFETPLYEPQKVSSRLVTDALSGTTKTTVDGYCPKCRRDSVFHSVPKGFNLDGVCWVEFVCQRELSHRITIAAHCRIVVQKSENALGLSTSERIIGSIKKIGQIPSHADLARGNIDRFASLLKGPDRAEFMRANGLAAVGVNIGAFVYLRRVFERLLERAKVRAGTSINSEKYKASRVTDRIDMLAAHLPEFMVENKKIYGVLSKGIHELDEESCAALYNLANNSCLLMLEQEKDIKEKKN